MADFSLKAVFGMDTTGVRTELKQLRRELNNFVEDYAKLGAGMAVAAFAALSKGAIDLAGKLSDTSQNIGINVVSLQALEAQHKRNGVSGETLTKVLEKTKATILDASAGNEKAIKSLTALGLSTERLIKLPLDRQYEEIAKAAAKSKNEAQAYTAVCDILGDKVGPKLMTSLKELGTVGLPGVTRSAREAGHVMEKETIAALDRAGDAIDDFKKRATVAVGNILVNFRSEEGLKLLGMQVLKILGEFGGGIVDAIIEGGRMINAVFSGAFRGSVNLLRDGMIDSAKLLASVMNKILPERFEIKIGNLDQFKSSGKGVSDSIIEALAKTEPSTFRKTIGETWDENIKKQQKVVDALNQKDFGEDAKKIADAAKPMKEAAKDVADAGTKVGGDIVTAAQTLRSAMEGVLVQINRTGSPYESQSLASLQGVKQKLESQITAMERASFGQPGGVGGNAKPAELYLLQNELFNISREIKLRHEAAAYAGRYGENAARGQFGDSVVNRSIQDLTKENVRTANAVEQINRRLGTMLGQPT